MDDTEPQTADLSVVFDALPIHVHDTSVGGVQICPAIVVGCPQALPGAAKTIYSRLASSANEVDEGMPNVIMPLVAHGNQLSREYVSDVEKALVPMASCLGLWFLSSGEQSDPLATAAANTLSTVLSQADDSPEVLHVLINSSDVTSNTDSSIEMVDSRLNTLLLLSRTCPEGCEVYRAQASVRIARPPPALLIGLPSEHVSTGMTPLTQAPPILLSTSNDKRPLSVAIFAGASMESLKELQIFIDNGIPVLILQDSCELCAVLYSASLLLETSSRFERQKFRSWLNDKLSALGFRDETVEVADRVETVLAAAISDQAQLIEFIDRQSLYSLSSRLVHILYSHYASTVNDVKQVVQIAANLDEPSILGRLQSNDVIDEEVITTLLCSKRNCVGFLSALLKSEAHISVSSEMLLKIANNCDQHFYTTVVLCRLLGYSFVPDEIDDVTARHLDRLLTRLSCGVSGLFPSSAFNGDILHKDSNTSLRILAVWCLLLHRPCLVQCLVAHSEEPLAFSLVLSRIAKSLAHEAHDWFFYEESLNKLSAELSSFAVGLVDTVHHRTPTKAYQVLCQPLENFNRLTVSQLAFQCNIRTLVAHESCQRWVHRLLYGRLQACGSPSLVPKWMKIVMAAAFIVPIRFWMVSRPSNMINLNDKDKVSPTVALLDQGRQPKRTRTYSVVSTRSDTFTNITAPLSATFPLQMTAGYDPATPQSVVFPLSIDDPDDQAQRYFVNKPKLRRGSPPSVWQFYNTPIVKYWLSFLFRLLHIAVFTYSVLLPGCGSASWDTVVWTWCFMTWCETLFVLSARNQTTPLSLMPWRVFDVVVNLLFLLLMLTFKLLGNGVVSEILGLGSAYPARVISAFYLLYFCYATLFTYIPLSDIFGPLIVRVKLMILRDFTNFLIMIALVMASSGAAIHAVSYPDRAITMPVIRQTLSWIWLSLFTTDLSSLKESDQCRKTFLGVPQRYCQSLGQYANPTCPAQSWPAYLVLIEYFVLLKLILWPVLFAFFAKTAKAVDEEADVIWKYQLFGLAHDFSLRPALPPPLTPLMFVLFVCCRCRGRTHFWTAVDHPDVDARDRSRSTTRYGSVYRNPSVPFKRDEFAGFFWRQLAREYWTRETQSSKKENTECLAEIRHLQEQVRMLTLSAAYDVMSTNPSNTQISRVPYASSGEYRLQIAAVDTPWKVVLPGYSPPFYCRPSEDFPEDQARYVENATEQTVSELRVVWRERQVQELWTGRAWRLSGAGFPLNPAGRKGIAGRGLHPRFGSNKRTFYVIIAGNSKRESKVLLDNRQSLPNHNNPVVGSRDERLCELLKPICVSHQDAQLFSLRRLDTSVVTSSRGVADTGPAHIAQVARDCDEDTDNAWTEHDVWAVALRSRRVSSNIPGFNWQPVGSLSVLPHGQSEHVHRALTIYGIN